MGTCEARGSSSVEIAVLLAAKQKEPIRPACGELRKQLIFTIKDSSPLSCGGYHLLCTLYRGRK
ncbi:hypothetical protein EYF80_018706 [Liparis tanakae]|uniref:Uncharacterized protein n=1 Tax=Liparis tanakae TaxID=230148 RepID=A0A4Z2I0D4_9TELE|nr:hypothetical protein EYF80_018706 [Liparis tanakae]